MRRREFQLPSYTLRREIERRGPLNSVRDELGDDKVAKAATRRRLRDSGPVPFNPRQAYAFLVRVVPTHRYAAFGPGEGAVLAGVGCQLMQRETDILNGISAEKQGGPRNVRAV